jgi:hypothetical protein
MMGDAHRDQDDGGDRAAAAISAAAWPISMMLCSDAKAMTPTIKCDHQVSFSFQA